MNSLRATNMKHASVDVEWPGAPAPPEKKTMDVMSLNEIFLFQTRNRVVVSPHQRQSRDQSPTAGVGYGSSRESRELPSVSFHDMSSEDVDEQSCLTDDLLSDDLSLRLPSSRSPSDRIDHELPVYVWIDSWRDSENDDVFRKMTGEPKHLQTKKRRNSSLVDTAFFDDDFSCTFSVVSEDMDDDNISWIGSYDFVKNDYSVVSDDMSFY